MLSSIIFANCIHGAIKQDKIEKKKSSFQRVPFCNLPVNSISPESLIVQISITTYFFFVPISHINGVIQHVLFGFHSPPNIILKPKVNL